MTPDETAADETAASIRRALISVSDKTGLAEFARFLAGRDVEILSTGGSAKAISDAGVAVTLVCEHTGFPEILDGRVKTLHPRIHGGILGRRDLVSHREAMKRHDIPPIDLVIVNLYPFAETVASGADRETCIETIDIGGPALIRAAAKNHAAVAVVVDPRAYADLRDEIAAAGGLSPETRKGLAQRAYRHTAAYDNAIAEWMAAEWPEAEWPERTCGATKTLSARLTFGGVRLQSLRYGENPHQAAAFYRGGGARPGVATATQLQGKALSYNNLSDADAAYELVAEFAPDADGPAVAIVKHASPCGAALGATLADAYRRALACDPVSAFGGVIACNRPVDGEAAQAMAKLFAEVIIAPAVTDAARSVFASMGNLRVLEVGGLPDPTAPGLTVRALSGGYLAQDRDTGRVTRESLKIVTKRRPSEAELGDLLFAFRVAKHVKSNAIVYARDRAAVGIGAGQASRVDSARIAAWKARERARPREDSTGGTGGAVAEDESRAVGGVVASDAFFPFPDGLLAAADVGVTAAIQPGGSMRDKEVIAAADAAGLAMVFTGMRHFRH